MSFVKSSRNPIAPQASVANRIVSDCSRKCETGRKPTVAAKRMSSPPIVGVPCFAK